MEISPSETRRLVKKYKAMYGVGKRSTRSGKWSGYKGIRHCVEEEPGKSGKKRCKIYAVGKPVPGTQIIGYGKKSKGIRKCIEEQEVYSPALRENVKRCKKYEGLGARCASYKEVYSPALRENVRRCAAYEGGCPYPMMYPYGYGGITVGGELVYGGDEANKMAAARSPWLEFIRIYEEKHPRLIHNRPELFKQASRAYPAWKRQNGIP